MINFASRLRREKHSSGVTMLEMLVLVAAILIVTAALVPMFKTMRDAAKKIKCLSHLKQLGVAIHLYVQDDGQARFPGWGETCDEVKNLPALLYSYLGEENTNALLSGDMFQFRCPVQKDETSSSAPSRVDAYKNQVDDAINCNLMGQASVGNIPGYTVRNDTIAALLWDYPVSNGIHSRGTNFLFVDGHAEWISVAKINSPWPDAEQYAGNDYRDWGLEYKTN
ncbi:MAG: prepilin-type N-terminal cleavage/methylation domain-containing protein [Chlamydiae bacterium]|nr:prepilin-type N-terminal cleavage/methylation domain-containing protein [Chlamydiota bacterium]MBI3276339.1 prepilin-type N-terminal cleavage/methylation domain-containing protein [Chlamydiota bacterium]